MSIFSQRRKRALELADGHDLIVTRPENLFYFTDFYGFGIGIVKHDKTIVVTTALEEERVGKDGNEAEVRVASSRAKIWNHVMKHIDKRAIVDNEINKNGLKANPKLFSELRKVKDDEEIMRISKAAGIIDKIFAMLEREIRQGRSEREIAAEILKVATIEGATPSGFEGSLAPTILASGENSSLPHAEVTDRLIRNGDIVIADLSFRYRGYCADSTRTFAVGMIDNDRKMKYNAVLQAQLKGIELSRHGIKCSKIHNAVVSILAKSSLEHYFIHGTGHGVGINVHEEPSIWKKSKDILRKNEVITIEPGIYFKSNYGIRIEDTILINDEPRVLNKYTKELVIVG